MQGVGAWDQAQEGLMQAHLASIDVHQRKALTLSRHQDPETLFSLGGEAQMGQRLALAATVARLPGRVLWHQRDGFQRGYVHTEAAALRWMKAWRATARSTVGPSGPGSGRPDLCAG